MDRRMSRSATYLPRYQSASPGRPSRLLERTLYVPRSFSLPRSKILYTATSSPHRAVYSCMVHQSPSPHRSHKQHLICTGSPSPRVTRKTLSLHDVSSSHLYTDPENVAGGPSLLQAGAEAAATRKDIYHKGPFYPDCSPSESGISLGESDLSMLEDDDSMSQHSFGSSSAFFDMTVDSELSDAAHTSHGTARGRRRDVPSPDSNRSSPLSYTQARKRELMASPPGDFDRVQSRFQALKVSIPGGECSSPRAKSPKERRRASSPVAQSTPHMSPRGFGDARLSIKACWNVDEPAELSDVEVDMSNTLDDSDLPPSIRAVDSSCNSSFSEDGAADISNVSIADRFMEVRKTKLVKKSSKTNTRRGFEKDHESSDVPDPDLVRNLPSPPRDEEEELEKNPVSSGIQGTEWWAVYNIETASARERKEQDGELEHSGSDNETSEKASRKIRVVKPVKVGLPLITAGKHGQEKLQRRRSSPSSQPGSPHSISPFQASPTSSPMSSAPQTPSPTSGHLESPEIIPLEGETQVPNPGNNNIEPTAGAGIHCEPVVFIQLENAGWDEDNTQITNRGGNERKEENSFPIETPSVPAVDLERRKGKRVEEINEREGKRDEKWNEGEGEMHKVYPRDQPESMKSGGKDENQGLMSAVSGREGNQGEQPSTAADAKFAVSSYFPCVPSVSSEVVNEESEGRGQASSRRIDDVGSESAPTSVCDVTVAKAQDDLALSEVSWEVGEREGATRPPGDLSSQPSQVRGREGGAHLAHRPPTPPRHEEVREERDQNIDAVSAPVSRGGGGDGDGTIGREIEPAALSSGPENDQHHLCVSRAVLVLNKNLSVGLDGTIETVNTNLQGKCSGLCGDGRSENGERQQGDTEVNETFCEFWDRDVSESNEHHHQEQGSKGHGGGGGSSVTRPPRDGLVEIPGGEATMDWSIDPSVTPEVARHGVSSRETPPQLAAQPARSTVVVVATAQKIPEETPQIPGSGVSAFSQPYNGFQNTSASVYSSAHNGGGGDLDPWSNSISNTYSQGLDNGLGVNSGAGSQDQGFNQRVLGETRSSDVRDRVTAGVDNVEAGRESIRPPGAQSGESVPRNREDFSSKQVLHTHRTTTTTTIEETVTTERTHNPPCVVPYVDVVTDKCVKHTVIKEKDDSVTTTTTTTYNSSLYPDSGVGDSSFVSTLNTTADNSLNSSLNDSEPPAVPQVSPSQLLTPEDPCAEDVTENTRTVYLSPSGARLCDDNSRSCVGWSSPADQPSVTVVGVRAASPYTIQDRIEDRPGLVKPGSGVTPEVRSHTQGNQDNYKDPHSCTALGSAMHTNSTDLLDTLQARLSQLSSHSPVQESHCDGEGLLSGSQNGYHDHAEATSVLKQIVRGDFTEYSNFSNGLKLAKFPTTLPSELDNENSQRDSVCTNAIERESYDNEAESASTDLPRNGCSRTPMQLMKPGQFKASSLWTLQEETESLLDASSPRVSPRRSVSTERRGELVRTRVSESPELCGSEGHYTSVSTCDSGTDWSSSRERTPLSDSDHTMEWTPDIPTPDHLSSFHDFVSGLQKSDTIASPTQIPPGAGSDGARSLSPQSTFRTSLAFGLSRPQDESHVSGMQALDNLSATLEQLNATSGFVSATESLDVSSSTLEGDRRTGGTEEFAHEASCRLHSLDLDLSRISSYGDSPSPSNFSEVSNFTCTGTAEVRKWDDFDYDTIPDPPVVQHIPVPTPKPKPLKSALKRPLPVEERSLTEHQKETMKRFDEILRDFHRMTSPEAIHEVRFMEVSGADTDLSTTTSTSHAVPESSTTTTHTTHDDLYKAFTNEDSEKKQNNTCVVVEDENMGTFRFKRFLKKSHSRRNKKGRRVMRFLSRLSCVSESVHSPDMSANRKQILETPTYNTDSMPSPKIRKISHPVSFTTFHPPKEVGQVKVLGEQHHHSPFSSPDKSPVKSTPSSSNQSLDSLRSRTDSAYSSISESIPSGYQLQSPTRECFHWEAGQTGTRTLSTDSAFSVTPGSATRTFSVFSEAKSPNPDLTLPHSDSTRSSSKALNSDMLSALSDVFDQLDVCEGEIDSALLNRLRHGHHQATENEL